MTKSKEEAPLEVLEPKKERRDKPPLMVEVNRVSRRINMAREKADSGKEILHFIPTKNGGAKQLFSGLHRHFNFTINAI